MRLSVVSSLLAAALAVSAPALVSAQSDDEAELVAGGAWHAKSVPCADGVVQAVTPRLGQEGQKVFTKADFDGSGVVVQIHLPSNPRLLPGIRFPDAGVVHYQQSAGNDLMRSEHRGDRVQVCLTSYPLPRVDPKTHAVICDPTADPRGFIFRVYDYQRHAAYMGPNTQHGCGGA